MHNKIILTVLSILLVLAFTLPGCSGLKDQEWHSVGFVTTGGSLLISDPGYLPDVEASNSTQVQVAPGDYEIRLLTATVGDWGKRVVRAQILFNSQKYKSKRELGSVGVDSGMLSVVDPNVLAEEWVSVGPNRNGEIYGADKEKIADVLQQSGYEIATRDEYIITLADTINEDDERKIKSLIDSNGLKGFLLINTGSSYDLIADALDSDVYWTKLTFPDGSQGFIVAFYSGLGDGVYPIYGLYNGTTLTGIEIDME